MTHTKFFISADANDEPCVWTPGEYRFPGDTRSPRPVCVVRKSDLAAPHREALWALIAAGVKNQDIGG